MTATLTKPEPLGPPLEVSPKARKLAKAIEDHSDKPLMDFRSNRKKFLRALAGPWAGIPGANDAQGQVQLLTYLLQISLPYLEIDPMVEIKGLGGADSTEGYGFSLALNDLNAQDDSAETLRQLIVEAYIARGVSWTGIGDSDTHTAQEPQGWLRDPGKPGTFIVSEPNFIDDTTRPTEDSWQFRGHGFWCDAEWASDCGLYDADEIQRLVKAGANKRNKDKSGEDSYRPEVYLRSVHLPRENKLVTIAGDLQEVRDYLSEAEYTGPEGGQYHILSFLTLPDTTWPVSPMACVYELQATYKDLLDHIIEMAMGEKTVYSLQPGAEAQGKTVGKAKHGDIVYGVSDPKAMKYEGASESSKLAATFILDLWNRMANNPDLLGGNRAKTGSDTLGEVQLLTNSAGMGMNGKRKRISRFLKQSMTAKAYFLWNSQKNMTTHIQRQVPGAPPIPDVWVPGSMPGKFEDYRLSVVPYNARGQSPQEEYENMTNWMTTFGVPLFTLASQRGQEVDANKLLDDSGKLIGIENAGEYLKAAVPMQAPTMSMAGADQGGFQATGTRPSVGQTGEPTVTATPGTGVE